MLLFPVPPKVVKKLDKLRRTFLWKGERGIGQGLLSMKWNTVMLSNERGALGIRNLGILNILFMKWLWRYTSEERTLWKEVIAAKYG